MFKTSDFTLLLIVGLALSEKIQRREVVLSTGIGGFSREKLQVEYDLYSKYASEQILTISSVLLYGIGEDGRLFWWNTSSSANWTAKAFQQDIGRKLGLKQIPTLFCDSTIGNCAPLTDRMDKVFERQNDFIQETIVELIENDWDGYAVDLESFHSIDSDKISQFTVSWAQELSKIHKELIIWTGGPTWYNTSFLNETATDSLSNVLFITMNTYNSFSGEYFIDTATSYLKYEYTPKIAGFGLLVPPSLHSFMKHPALVSPRLFASRSDVIVEDDMKQIASWCLDNQVAALSVWASRIPDAWVDGLKLFLHGTKQ